METPAKQTQVAEQQLMYRNLAAIQVWAFRRAIDPSVPPWDDLSETEKRAIANAVVRAAIRLEV